MVESGGIGLVFNLKPKVPVKQPNMKVNIQNVPPKQPNMQVNIQNVPPKQLQPNIQANIQNVPATNMENNLKRPAGRIRELNFNLKLFLLYFFLMQTP